MIFQITKEIADVLGLIGMKSVLAEHIAEKVTDPFGEGMMDQLQGKRLSWVRTLHSRKKRKSNMWN